MAKKIKTPEENLDLCGKCTKCCEYIALEIDKPTTQQEFDEVRWYLLHENIMIFIDEGDWYIYMSTPCSNLGRDGKCQDYDNRPQICREYDQGDCDRESEVFYDVLFRKEADLIKWMKKNKKKVKTHKAFK